MIDRIIGILSIPITLVMVFLLIRQVNKPQPVNPKSIWVGLSIAVLTLLVNLLFMRQAQPGIFGPLLLIGGMVLGLARWQASQLSIENGAVTARQSIMHLIFWGLSASVTQLLASFAPARWVAGGLAMIFFSTGTTLGTNFNLLLRQKKLKTAEPASNHFSHPAAESTSSFPTTIPK